MASKIITILGIFLCLNGLNAAECETGWTLYKDEVCLKIADGFFSYDEARQFCASEGNSVSTATLVIVKDAEFQEALTKFTNNSRETFWLGGRNDSVTSQFKWDDGELLSYTNWQDGYPRYLESCIQFKPMLREGQWVDATCAVRNRVICQRTVPWSLEDATREILRLRRRNSALQSQLDKATEEQNNLLDKLEQVNGRVVPLGSIYVEYANQLSPRTLWPSLKWEDITNSYAGIFFRALGGGSEEWGTTQKECAPKISQIEYQSSLNGEAAKTQVPLPNNGWPELCHAGWSAPGEPRAEKLRLEVEDCKIRPTNQAIRIWKRVA